MNYELSNKNTLLFTLEYPPFKGGVANYYGNLIKYWHRENKNYIPSDYFTPLKMASNDKITVLTGKKLIRPHWIFSLWYLWRAVKKNKINIVLVGQILPLGIVTWLLHKICKFEYAVFLHGMDLSFAMKVSRKKKLARKILRDAKKIIAVNSRVAMDAEEIVDSKKITVINPGVHLGIRNQEPEIKNKLIKRYNLQNKKILLQVGRLVERKGYDMVIEALPKILQVCPELKYVIIGNGPKLDNLRLQIADRKLEDNVILITGADDQELEVWYDLCDIFIMPSREIGNDYEGFGIVYLEANAHGKPVIAGDSGGVRDAVKNNVNGLLVNPKSIKEIAGAVIKLCEDDESRKKLGKQGRERVERDFLWEKQVEKIRKFIF